MSDAFENAAAAELSGALRELLKVLPDESVGIAVVPNRRRLLRAQILNVIQRLEAFSRKLDPIQIPSRVFDPADPKEIGRFIGETLLEQERIPLSTMRPFYGSGVYAIYSRSDFEAYLPIKGTNTPIYVGKADPKVLTASTPEEQGDKLWQRISRDHVKSIFHAKNLNLEDFDCRYLVVKSAWHKTAEDYLIDLFKPIWNNQMKICFGFGKHGDSSETRNNARSPWDTLHPGRPWAGTAATRDNRQSALQIQMRILEHFKIHPPRK